MSIDPGVVAQAATDLVEALVAVVQTACTPEGKAAPLAAFQRAHGISLHPHDKARALTPANFSDPEDYAAWRALCAATLQRQYLVDPWWVDDTVAPKERGKAMRWEDEYGQEHARWVRADVPEWAHPVLAAAFLTT